MAKRRIEILLAEPYHAMPPRLALLGLEAAINERFHRTAKVSILPAEIANRSTVRSADLIVFSVANALEYPSILGFLKATGLPRRSSERGDSHPLVIAGGIGVANPEPLADFIDVVICAPSYEPLLRVVSLLVSSPTPNAARERVFSTPIPGAYVPSAVACIFSPDGTLHTISGRYVPYTGPTRNPPRRHALIGEHEAVLLSDLGCRHKCSFCALSHYFDYVPVDEACLSDDINYLHSIGVRQVKINSATAPQHPSFLPLLSKLRERGMGVAVGSFRVDQASEDVLQALAGIHRISDTQFLYRRKPRNAGPAITFGIEAGSDRLLRLINKNLSIGLVKERLQCAAERGVTNFGMYFLLGLPTETHDDLCGIADVVKFAYSCVASADGELYVGINPLIATPHTPMQRVAVLSCSQYRERLEIVRGQLRCAIGPDVLEDRIHITPLDDLSLLLETVLVRGDRRVGRIIELMVEDGDAANLSESHFQRCLQAACLPNLEFFRRRIALSERVPWELTLTPRSRAAEAAYCRRESCL